MESSEPVKDDELRENFRKWLIRPVFIGDLAQYYHSEFGKPLDFPEGLLKLIDSCSFLRLEESYVEFTEFRSGPIENQLLFGTLEGRLKFLLPKTKLLFYEDLPGLYKVVFGETFESGPHLLHFIENQPCLKIDSYIFVSYNDPDAVIPRPVGNPRHKEFLTKRFIFLLRLFPKSPADLSMMYKKRFGEDLPVKVNLLPAIFKNFLGDYFAVSSTNMIYFAAPRTKPKAQPEIPPELLGYPNPDPADPHNPAVDRLIYLKHTRRLDSRYIQFMYYDVFGEPITDFAMFRRFINAAYESTTEHHLDAYDLAQVYEPDKEPSFHDTVKAYLGTGPKAIRDVLNTCLLSRGFPIEIFKQGFAVKELLSGIPGVLVRGSTVELTQNSPNYVNRLLCAIVQGSSTRLSDLPRLFKETYGYTIPDDCLLREYVLADNTLQIDANGNVMKKSVVNKPIEKAPSTPVTVRPAPPPLSTSVSDDEKKRDQTQRKNLRILLKNRAIRLDQIREEYKRRFLEDLVVNTKLTAWIQTIEGVLFDSKTQMVSCGLSQAQIQVESSRVAGLSQAQEQVIALLLDVKELNFDKIPAECKKRFGMDLAYKGQLKSWLCNIPGLVISPSRMCTYGRKMTGGSMLDLREKKLKSKFSMSTPDIRPRSQEEKAVDIISAHPNSTLNEFLIQFKEQYGEWPSYGEKLKTWLLSIPGVLVSPNDRISMQPKDVATNAKLNIAEILKHKKWVPVEVFAEDYKKLFGVSGNMNWILSRQKEIDFLMLLNYKVRYEELNAQSCLQYVKYLAKICGGISVHQVESVFPLVYGFRLPASMLDLVRKSFPTGDIGTKTTIDLRDEINEVLRNLDPSRVRALLLLMQRKTWIRIEHLIRDAKVQVQDMSESAFCESIPSVTVKNSRVKFHAARSLLPHVEEIVSWLGIVRFCDLPVLFKRLFGYTVKPEQLPLAVLKTSSSLEVCGDLVRSKSPHSVWASRPTAADELINHSDNQLHRLFRVVAQNTNIELGKLECMYQEKFGAPIISLLPSFKLCIQAHSEFVVNDARVSLVVPLSEALRDLAMNQLSTEHSMSKPMQMNKLNIPVADGNGSSLECGKTSNIPSSTTDNRSGSDSHSDASVTTKPSNVDQPSLLKPTECNFFDSLIGDRERSMKELCNGYKNKFKSAIEEAELEQRLIIAGYCCTGGKVHYSCKQRLLFLLSTRELSQDQVIVEFTASFSRSPCYEGTLRKYLLSLGCVESKEKLFRFPLKRVRAVETPDTELMERLLSIIEFRNRSFDVSSILEEYNKRFDPPLTQADLVAELKDLDFVFLSRKKKAFDCGGIHVASYDAMSEYLRRESENTLSLPHLARELPAKTGTELMYFGNLLKALQHVGFYVSNDRISYAAKPDSSVPDLPAEEKLTDAANLTDFRRVVKDLLRMESPLTYERLEKLIRCLGYRIQLSAFGCSDFRSFLRLYHPDSGLLYLDDVVELVEQSNDSPGSSPYSSPSRSSDQQCSTVLDVLRIAGPLIYPSELQAKFAELTDLVLVIPDSGAYLETLLRSTELVAKSDKQGQIKISILQSNDSEDET